MVVLYESNLLNLISQCLDNNSQIQTKHYSKALIIWPLPNPRTKQSPSKHAAGVRALCVLWCCHRWGQPEVANASRCRPAARFQHWSTDLLAGFGFRMSACPPGSRKLRAGQTRGLIMGCWWPTWQPDKCCTRNARARGTRRRSARQPTSSLGLFSAT